MKKIFFFLMIVLFATRLQAKSIFNDSASFETARAVKIGRSSSFSSSTSLNDTSITKASVGYRQYCDESCLTCDETTGTCSLCETGFYVSSNACYSCSSQHYCNGLTQIGYCDEVECINAITVVNDTGCCCESYCEDVTCLSGYTATPTANGCCCE